MPATPRTAAARTSAAKAAPRTTTPKSTTPRTPTTKATTARTPAKRTPARPSTARTAAAKKAEQTAAATAGVLDEVRAPDALQEPSVETTAATPAESVVAPATEETTASATALPEASLDAPAADAPATAAPAAEATLPTEAPAPERTRDAPVEAPVAEPAAPVKRPARRPVATPSPQAAPAPEAPVAQATSSDEHPIVLSISGLVKQFGDTVAVDGVDLEVRRGSFYGIVGPNGAGKTTTLSMVTGLLRPDAGTITVQGVDVWREPEQAKRAIGVLPDRLRLFDRLTGSQLLYYSGVLRGLDAATVKSRTADLARAFGLDDALGRLVSDYSAGMTKKIALAAALIHSPRVLILDEPFESVDPVSAANVIEILQRYVANGGTVVLSSHGMDFIQRVCDHVAIIVQGKVLAAGSVDEVRGTGTLEERFVELAGGRKSAEGMEWLHSFSD